jgi:3-mercaptopyruvate sulfurtransferase SseA
MLPGESMKVRWIAMLLAATISAGTGSARPFQGDEAAAPRVTIEQFKTMLASNSVTVLDVRSSEAFALGHIPGAVSMPFESIKSRISELKTLTKPIVAYCA